MSKPIVVGYDPRQQDRSPVEFGVTLARLTRSVLIVVSVDAGSGDADRHAEGDLIDDAAAPIAALQQELEDEGLDVRCFRIPGLSAAAALHDVVTRKDAGLLVLGSPPPGPLGLRLGSTAERLAHGAPCPLAVVPSGWHAGGELATVGVAFVDTAEGRRALHEAYVLAQRLGSRLRVFTVVRPSLRMLAETEATIPPRPAKDLTSVEGEHRVMPEEAARAAAAELGDAVAVDVDAFVGDAADVLIPLTERVDLMLCGSRGYGPLRGVLLGGVSRRLMAEARCPVVVVPRGVTSSLEQLFASAPGTAAAAAA